MAANIQAYLENLRQPWGQIYYDILFEQLKDCLLYTSDAADEL